MTMLRMLVVGDYDNVEHVDDNVEHVNDIVEHINDMVEHINDIVEHVWWWGTNLLN